MPLSFSQKGSKKSESALLGAVFDVLCRAKYVQTKSRFCRANPDLPGVEVKSEKIRCLQIFGKFEQNKYDDRTCGSLYFSVRFVITS